VALPKEASGITGRLQRFAHGHGFERQIAAIWNGDHPHPFDGSAFGAADGIDAMARRVLTGKHAGAAGLTIARRGVGVAKNHTITGQTVEIRRLAVVRPGKTGFLPAKVVSKDQHDIGSIRSKEPVRGRNTTYARQQKTQQQVTEATAMVHRFHSRRKNVVRGKSGAVPSHFPISWQYHAQASGPF
jgi:hypothetical protein